MEEINNIKSEQNEELSVPKNKVENLTVPGNLDVLKNPYVLKEKSIVADLINNNLVQGFIMSEILGPPKARERRGNTLWNSRF